MFRGKRSLGIRSWHWLNALTIIALLITVLLRRTILSVRDNAVLIKNKANEVGATLNDQQAREFARIAKDRLWDWHIYLGYFLSLLVIFRIIVFIVERKKTVINKNRHYRIVKWIHRSFYLALAMMVATGLAMVFDDDLHFSKHVNEIIQATHENMMWYVLTFVALHIAGVIKAEQGEDKGLISDMINGG